MEQKKPTTKRAIPQPELESLERKRQQKRAKSESAGKPARNKKPTLGRPLHTQCSVKAPQRPDIRYRKCSEDAIEQLQGRRLWSLLNSYRPPSLLHDQRGNQMNPLMLALQSASAGSDLAFEGPSPLAMLLDAQCDPNVLGEVPQSPLLMQVGSIIRRLKISLLREQT